MLIRKPLPSRLSEDGSGIEHLMGGGLEPHPQRLILDGIARSAEPMRLDLLLAGLGDGEAIEIAISTEAPDAAPELSLAVTAPSGPARDALADRLRLLAGAGPYVFRSADMEAGAATEAAGLLAEPTGLLLPLPGHTRSGPLHPVGPPDVGIVLPGYRSIQGGFDLGALVPLLQRAPDDLRLALRIESFVLSAQQRVLMGETAFMLAARDTDFECVTTAGDAVVMDAARRQELAAALAIWRRAGRGLRAALAFTSRAIAPPGLAALVGTAFFARPVRLQALREHGPAGGIDLRAAWPGASVPAGLLPGPAAMLRSEVPRAFPRSAARMPRTGMLIGHIGRGDAQPVRLSDADRSRHVQILGTTGAGKSTLLLNMFLQDVADGQGACLIDPHGDLFEQALAGIPRHRQDDVVVIDPTDTGHAVGLNLLEADPAGGAAARNFVINEMLSIFAQLYDMRVAGGPMFETYMRNAMLLLLEGGLPDASLVDIPRVFQDRVLRSAMLARCTNQLVVNFWQREAVRAGGDISLDNIAPYVTSKLNQFIGNALLRPIIGQPRSSIDFRRFMDEGRIVLVNLARGICGDLDSRLLGMVGIGKIFASALGRVRLPVDARRPFSLYIDECQHLLTPTMAQMLAEARKFGLRLVLANQTLGQLENGTPGMLASMMGNVGSLLLLRLGPIDAERVEIFTRPHLSAHELRALDDGQVAACLLVGGRPLAPFVFRSHVWPGVLDPRLADEARAASRRRHAVPVGEVEAAIARRLQPMMPPPREVPPVPTEPAA